MAVFNRVTLQVPGALRMLVDRTKDPEASVSDVYCEVLKAGLEALYPKEYKHLQKEWKEHVKECVDSGESSPYFRVKPDKAFV